MIFLNSSTKPFSPSFVLNVSVIFLPRDFIASAGFSAGAGAASGAATGCAGFVSGPDCGAFSGGIYSCINSFFWALLDFFTSSF